MCNLLLKKVGYQYDLLLEKLNFNCYLACNHPEDGNRGTGGPLRTHNKCFLARIPMSLNRRRNRKYPSPSQGEFCSCWLPRFLPARLTSHPVAVALVARNSARSASHRMSAALLAQPLFRALSCKLKSAYRELSPLLATFTDSVYKFLAPPRAMSCRRSTSVLSDELRVSHAFSVSCVSQLRKLFVFSLLCSVCEKISLLQPSPCRESTPRPGFAPPRCFRAIVPTSLALLDPFGRAC